MSSFLSNAGILVVVAFLLCFQGSSAPATEVQVVTSSASSGGETTAGTFTSSQGSSTAATTSTSSNGAATTPSGPGMFSPSLIRLSLRQTPRPIRTTISISTDTSFSNTRQHSGSPSVRLQRSFRWRKRYLAATPRPTPTAASPLFSGVPLQLATEEQVAATSSTSSGGETTAGTPTSSQGSSTAATTSTSTGGAATTPSGAGIFSPSPVRLSLSISEGYDDNVNTAPSNGQSSSYTSGNMLLTYAFGNPRLRLSLDTSAGITYYAQHVSNQDYDIDLHGHVVLQYKATPRLTLGSDVFIAYLTEPSFNYGVGLNSRAGNYLYTLDTFSANYLWAPRFSTVTHYTLTVVNYDDNSVGMLQDRVENTFGNEFRFLLTPVTGLVGEYRLELVNYTQAQNPLDSTTHFVLGGFDHTFNPRLNVTVHAGAEFRTYSDGGTRNSPYVEGNLNYTVGRRTTLSWINHYGLEEPDVVNSQNPTVFRTGLE